jgi:hypothetical protein
MRDASRSSRSPLAPIAGIESRNEKRAADSRFSPARSAPVIVVPEREEPGMRAKTWAQPTMERLRTPMPF